MWIPQYNVKKNLLSDAVAGLTVAAMLVPQGLAYAIVAGMPPIYGLYSAFIPPIIYAVFGTSRELSVAPVAISSLLVFEGISHVVPPTINGAANPEYAALAIIVTPPPFISTSHMSVCPSCGPLSSGARPLSARLHRVVFVPPRHRRLHHSVRHHHRSPQPHQRLTPTGLSQVSSVLGYSFETSTQVYMTLYNLFSKIGKTHWQTIVMAVITIAILMTFKKIKKLSRLPAALIVVVVSTGITYGARLDKTGLKIVGAVPSGLPNALSPISLPEFAKASELVGVMVSVALIGFMESIAVAKTFAGRKGYEVDPNQELIGTPSATSVLTHPLQASAWPTSSARSADASPRREDSAARPSTPPQGPSRPLRPSSPAS